MRTTNELRAVLARLEGTEIRGDVSTLESFRDLTDALGEALLLAAEGERLREALAAQGEIQRAAVLTEREACAKVAETLHGVPVPPTTVGRSYGMLIAAAIRARK